MVASDSALLRFAVQRLATSSNFVRGVNFLDYDVSGNSLGCNQRSTFFDENRILLTN